MSSTTISLFWPCIQSLWLWFCMKKNCLIGKSGNKLKHIKLDFRGKKQHSNLFDSFTRMLSDWSTRSQGCYWTDGLVYKDVIGMMDSLTRMLLDWQTRSTIILIVNSNYDMTCYCCIVTVISMFSKKSMYRFSPLHNILSGQGWRQNWH